jgi:hypothetical protein
MAERKRMTADQVVSYLLKEDGAHFLRESLKWVVQSDGGRGLRADGRTVRAAARERPSEAVPPPRDG